MKFILKPFIVLSLLLSAVSGLIAQNPTDAELADTIKRMANRSTEGLVETHDPNGGVTVDLKGRFQHVIVGRNDMFSGPKTGCIGSIEAANSFFGRNLETGMPISSDPFEFYKTPQNRGHEMTPVESEYFRRMIAEAVRRRSLSPNNASITINNNDGAGEGFNDPTAVTPEGGNNATTLGQQRLNVFDFAADIWEAFLDSSVVIEVNSNFDPLPCSSTSGVLGGASTTTLHRDFPNAGFAATWHVQALANKQSGADRAGNPDLNATFNSTINGNPGCLGGRRFYLGLDNATPANTANLLVTVMHEIGHGIGFSSFVDEADGTFFNGFTDSYTTFLYDNTTNKLWNDMSDAERMASAINDNNVFWDGPSLRVASGSQTVGRDPATGRIEMFTPNPIQQGSSTSHFNIRSSPNLIMEPNITLNLPLTLDLTRQVMRDMGWYRDTTADDVADTISNVTPSGGSVLIGSNATVNWTNDGGFINNVQIELSTDGGATYPTILASDIANTGSFSFTVPNSPTTQAKVRVREFDFVDPLGESAAEFSISNTIANPPRFDFDGDSKTDVSIFRPAPGEWWYLRSSDGGNAAFQFGSSSDILAPDDFTGDGKTDIAFFRPTSGEWFVLRSEDQSFFSFPFGTTGDIPVPGDYDGDGQADPAVFRPSTNTWFILNSGGGTRIETFGATGDRPVPSDYDGDGKTDIAIFRPGPAEWWISRSQDGLLATQFGVGTDRPVPGDFTGDGKSDVAFYRPASGEWFVLRSEDFSFFSFPFGTSGDIPTPGDYDGDGKADAAVFRPSNNTWFLSQSTDGFEALTFGSTGDIPIPSVYVP